MTNRSGQERYAIPFFMDCSYDAVMAPIPTCVTPDNAPRYPAFTYPEFMGEYSGANYGQRGQAAAGVDCRAPKARLAAGPCRTRSWQECRAR